MLRAMGWENKRAQGSVTAAAGAQRVALPRHMQDVISLFDATNSRLVSLVGIEQLDRDHSGFTISNVGEAAVYAKERIGAYNTSTVSTAETLTVSSSSSGDNIVVVVKALDSVTGSVVQESATVNGTTAVSFTLLPTSDNLEDVIEFSKEGDTAGTISLKASTTTISQIGPQDRTARYMWLKFPYALSNATTFTVTYTRRVPDLEDDIDVPILDGDDILVIGAVSDAFRTMNQFQKALAEEARFQEQLANYVHSRSAEGEETAQARGTMDEYRRT